MYKLAATTFYVTGRSCGKITIEHSNLIDMSGLYGEYVLVTCDEGFHPSDGSRSAFLVTCTEYGSWDGLLGCEGDLERLNYMVNRY